jgi:Sulfatase-modifying factor enzyme 1
MYTAIYFLIVVMVSCLETFSSADSITISNCTDRPVEIWLGDHYFGSVAAETAMRLPGQSINSYLSIAHAVPLIAVSQSELEIRINAIVLPFSSDGPHDMELIWGGPKIDRDIKQAEVDNRDRSGPRSTALVKEYLSSLQSVSGGRPLQRFSKAFRPPDDERSVRHEVLVAAIGDSRYLVDGHGILFSWIPAGSFITAAPTPRRAPITLSHGYWMSVTEVTRGHYFGARRASVEIDPARAEENQLDNRNLPILEVTWEEAVSWTNRLPGISGWSYGLPTEAQWENAARAGKPQSFAPSGDDITIEDIMWYGSNSGGRVHVVAGKLPNEYGLFDMHGNVREWCQDLYSPRKPPVGTDPTGASWGFERVRRGGSFATPAAWMGSGFRDAALPHIKLNDVGFRVVLQVENPDGS